MRFMRSCAMLLAGSFLLACMKVCQASSSDPPYKFCLASTPASPNCSLNSLLGDWLLVYSSDISFRKASSVWGPALPYDFCDPMNLNKGCMGVGVSFLAGNDKKQVGYTYAYNAFTDVWTIEQFTNSIYQLPNSSYTGYRITYNHYVQVADDKVFVDTKASACGTAILRSGPIYRSSNYVVLEHAPDWSWAVLLYCDSFYGFFIDSPLIQVYVKKDYMGQVSYPFNTCAFYDEIKDAIQKVSFNLYASDFNLIYHDENGNYPTSISWDSIQWESDCLCIQE